MAGVSVILEVMRIVEVANALVGAAQQGMVQTADTLAAAIQENAPVDTGNLRDSIYVATDGADVVIRIDADYAGFVEYGTSTRAAHPFIEPAIESSRVNMGLAPTELMWQVT